MNQSQTLVTIFTDANFLAVNLLENLLAKNCFINVVTEDKKIFLEKMSFISSKHFRVISSSEFSQDPKGYCIFICGFLRGNPYKNLYKFLSISNFNKSKKLVLMPFEKFSYVENSKLKPPQNTAIIYIGDLIGPRIDLNSDLFFPGFISAIFSNKKFAVNIGENLYPIFVGDAARSIGKWLFSFGPYGRETLLLGQRIPASFFGDVRVDTEMGPVREVPAGIEIKQVPCDLKFSTLETFSWLKRHPPEIKRITRPKGRRLPYTVRVVSALLLGLSLPVIFLIFGSLFLLFSYREFVAGKDGSSQNLMLTAKIFFVVSDTTSKPLAYLPFFGRIYKETSFSSRAGVEIVDIGISAVPVLRESSDLSNKVLGSVPYDSLELSAKIKNGLSTIYREASILRADTLDASAKGLWSAKFLREKIDLEKISNLALQGATLMDNFPVLTGKDSPKSYLLLFQNNMELRPTGGFIGSFGILTFDDGRITDLVVNDVYSADGQLNGHVEPPAAIKSYLNEANWYLRDSNWDPDFPTSAKRAEWFLDKEIGKTVDGVVAIDLEPTREVLKLTGPIFLADYNMSISSENLYERTQAEAEENFFPGTHKKASFLTALSRNLLSDVSALSLDKKMWLLKALYTSLEERHVQVYIHNDAGQAAIADLKWDGAIRAPDCGGGCYADFVGDIEANVGVNKANYFIRRSMTLSVNLLPDTITRSLTINLKNDSNPALGLAGKYRVYLRVMVQSDSNVISVHSVTGSTSQEIPLEITNLKDRKEIGFPVEIVGGMTKSIVVVWATPVNLSSFNNYGLYFRKQGGVGDDPISLTINGKSIYNSNLVGDYFGRFSL